LRGCRIADDDPAPADAFRLEPAPRPAPVAADEVPQPFPRHVPTHDNPDQRRTRLQARGDVRDERRQIPRTIDRAEVGQYAVEDFALELRAEVLHGHASKL